jgi:hypothetical protein
MDGGVWPTFASEKATAHPVWRVESAQREHGLDGPGSGCARDDEVEQASWVANVATTFRTR